MDDKLPKCLWCGHVPDGATENDWADPPEWHIVHICLNGITIIANGPRTKTDAEVAWTRAMYAPGLGRRRNQLE